MVTLKGLKKEEPKVFAKDIPTGTIFSGNINGEYHLYQKREKFPSNLPYIAIIDSNGRDGVSTYENPLCPVFNYLVVDSLQIGYRDEC